MKTSEASSALMQKQNKKVALGGGLLVATHILCPLHILLTAYHSYRSQTRKRWEYIGLNWPIFMWIFWLFLSAVECSCYSWCFSIIFMYTNTHWLRLFSLLLNTSIFIWQDGVNTSGMFLMENYKNVVFATLWRNEEHQQHVFFN